MYGLARWWVVARIVECLRVCRAWTLDTWTGSQLHSRLQQSVLQHVRVLLPRFSERKQILLVVCLTEIRGEGGRVSSVSLSLFLESHRRPQHHVCVEQATQEPDR